MHVHISGLNVAIIFLSYLVIVGTVNLLAMKCAENSSLAASYCNLFGLDH